MSAWSCTSQLPSPAPAPAPATQAFASVSSLYHRVSHVCLSSLQFIDHLCSLVCGVVYTVELESDSSTAGFPTHETESEQTKIFLFLIKSAGRQMVLPMFLISSPHTL